MASSRKRQAEPAGAAGRLLGACDLSGRRVAVGLSGGVDSVVLLHVLKGLAPKHGFELRALHVNHGLSPNARGWQRFCRELCRDWRIPFARRRAVVGPKRGRGLEAAAREARYAAYRAAAADAIALAHQLDDQAESVLMNLLRGAGVRGASGMPAVARLGAKLLLRPLLEVPREAIVAYARAQGLDWVEDETNRDEALTRNFVRLRLAPLLAARFPRWRESLARAARHFAAADADAKLLLREFLAARGMRAPSERKLLEMLKQLGSGRPGARTAILHDGALLRVWRGALQLSRPGGPAPRFEPLAWGGEARLALPGLGGELLFRRRRGAGIDAARLEGRECELRARAGGERLQPDARRPRRTLKNLFQESGVPPWERDRLPLLFCGEDLVWVPGIGVDARYQATPGARGVLPEWRRAPMH
jgi:tRNA(Ile)-lysidine synthase